MAKELPRLKLGKGAAFVKTRLKQLPQEEETWEADFRALPKPRGLMPEFIGQGLGRYFLQWTIDKAWSYKPRRLWLHTCTLDHPAALPIYQKAGFTIHKEETIKREIPVTHAGSPSGGPATAGGMPACTLQGTHPAAAPPTA